MRYIFLGMRILSIKVAIVGQQFGGGDFPGVIILFPLLPPVQTGLELLELEGLGFGVVLAAFGQWLLVIPNFLCWAGSVEEEEIRRYAGVRSENAVGQADDGVKVEILQQFFFDSGAHAVLRALLRTPVDFVPGYDNPPIGKSSLLGEGMGFVIPSCVYQLWEDVFSASICFC